MELMIILAKLIIITYRKIFQIRNSSFYLRPYFTNEFYRRLAPIKATCANYTN